MAFIKTGSGSSLGVVKPQPKPAEEDKKDDKKGK